MGKQQFGKTTSKVVQSPMRYIYILMEWNLGKKMTSGILFKELERSLS